MAVAQKAAAPKKASAGAGSIKVTAGAAGKVVRLNASRSTDPDGDALSFKWWQQLEIGDVQLSIDGADTNKVSIRIPDDAQGKVFHVICEVHDNGPFHLVAYRRVIIMV